MPRNKKDKIDKVIELLEKILENVEVCKNCGVLSKVCGCPKEKGNEKGKG